MTDLTVLTGPDAGDILQAALAAAGGEVLTWRAVQVDPQRAAAAYRVRVRWSDGRVSEERFGARAGETPPGALVIGDDVDRVAVWRLPHDPYLPGLALALDQTAVAGLRQQYGLGAGPVSLVLRAYRPCRRAVVEATGPGGRLFLKVVLPQRVAALHARHRLFTRAGVPAPHSLGYTPEGVLALAELPGQTLRQALRARQAPLPSGGQVLDLLDRLPTELAAEQPRRGWHEAASRHARVVGQVLPAEAARARQLAEAVLAGGDRGPVVPVHGDFYENQLLVAGGRIRGVLDIDTAGAGDRVDDLACLLGHLSVLAGLQHRQEAAISRLGARYLRTFERTVDPADLRGRIAAVVLSLATGPHRVQEAGWQAATRYRLELAERWLASAQRMNGFSSSPQEPLTSAADAGDRRPARSVRAP